MSVTSDYFTTDDISEVISTTAGFTKPAINYTNLWVVLAFYAVIFIIGIAASIYSKSFRSDVSSEEVMIAKRDINIVVGIFTMTATWVGGGYINGTAEYIANPDYGLAWTIAPFGYSTSLVIAGLFYAAKMRERNYVTMLDPFEQRYGRVMTALLYVPALLGEVCWLAAILHALGGTLMVIVGLDKEWSVIISAGIAVLYTMAGGLYSVAYTDVFQLICIAGGLWVTIPYAMGHEAVQPILDTMTLDPSRLINPNATWLGVFPEGRWIGNWMDNAALLVFGGIPWQVYFQRVLSARSPARAQLLSYVAAFGCLIMALPAVIIGAIAFSTDWSKTDYNSDKFDYALSLPLVMQYLTPTWVAVCGLSAVSAAVMSSADSSVLSASSMFTRNIYSPLRRAISSNKASEPELIWILRVSIMVVGAVATYMAITIDSIYGLWYLCADLIYVILFPQLTCVLYMERSNAYGSLCGFVLGCFFRLTGGEVLIGLAPLFKYWYDSESGYQLFPFKTMTMLISFAGCILGSLLAEYLYDRGWFCRDVFEAFSGDERETEIKENPGDMADSRYMDKTVMGAYDTPL